MNAKNKELHPASFDCFLIGIVVEMESTTSQALAQNMTFALGCRDREASNVRSRRR
jgi:hypothetical protein